MSIEFKGDLPEINIRYEVDYVYYYTCAETGRQLFHACDRSTPLSSKCFDCIGMNAKFIKYYIDNRHCSCGYKVDFGYFILIFHFEKAGLLPKDFMMMCCACYNIKKKKVVINIDG